MNSPLIVESNNLSVAWGNAFLQVYQAGEISPLVVVINGLDNAEPSEIPVIRKLSIPPWRQMVLGYLAWRWLTPSFPYPFGTQRETGTISSSDTSKYSIASVNTRATNTGCTSSVSSASAVTAIWMAG